MVKKGSILLMCMIALVAFAAWAPNVSAFPNFYDDNCAGCHGNTTPPAEPARTCAGCHAHGVHSNGAKNDINVEVTTDKAVYLPGEPVTVSIAGGYQDGWVRAKLFDENDNEVDVASNNCPTCPVDVGGLNTPTENFPGPITLTALAPMTPGTVMWSASWYGNEFDSGSGTFGNFVPDPTNAGHGDEIITFSFDVVECTVDTDCDDGVACTVDTCNADGSCSNTPDDGLCDDGIFCNGAETCDPSLGCQDEADPCDPATETCDEVADACVPLPTGCTSDAECDDGAFCNGAETCDTGTGECQPGTAPCDPATETCDEGQDVCVPLPTGCTSDAECDDGAFCNGDETCNVATGECQPGTAPCDPATETCDEGQDVCIPDRTVVEVKVKVQKFINPKNRGVTPIKLVSDMDVKFAEVTCEGATAKRFRQKYFSELDMTFAIGLFKTRELGIECGDMTLTCTGTLDGTAFEGTSNKFKTVGRACKDKDDDDKDDDDKDDDDKDDDDDDDDKKRRDKHDRDDD